MRISLKLKDKGARIQVLDLPGIIEGAAEGKGRGRQVISTARTCNLILVVLDAAKLRGQPADHLLLHRCHRLAPFECVFEVYRA